MLNLVFSRYNRINPFVAPPAIWDPKIKLIKFLVNNESFACDLVYRLSYYHSSRLEEIRSYCSSHDHVRYLITSPEEAPYNYGRNVEIQCYSHYDMIGPRLEEVLHVAKYPIMLTVQ